jgi:hypothetical protein
LNPKYTSAYISRGNVKLALGSKSGAELDWARAEKIQKKYSDISPSVDPATV